MTEALLLAGSESPPGGYRRDPEYKSMVKEKDVAVAMRDGVDLSVDVYRPDAPGKFPALLAFAIYNKDLQGPDVAEQLPPQPAWASLWAGLLEAGDTKFFVSRGYVHVIGSPRGIGKSGSGGSREWDCYDLIEWIAKQPWCDGNVGMVGISGFGAEQLMVAKQQPPALKAIFPFDPRGAYGPAGGFRDEHPGGMLHLFRYLIGHFSAFHGHRGAPGDLPPERDKLWRAAMDNPDYKIHPHVYNVVAQKGQHMPPYFDLLLNPYDSVAAVERSEAEFEKVKVPTYTGSGWYAYTYKTHLNGAQNWFRELSAPKKMLLTGPAVLNLFAAIDQDDTNWIVTLKDVGPDGSVRSAREGERDVPAGLPERELTRGWLKASHRALDPKRSRPERPWHPLTREAQKPVEPGKVEEYAIEIMATANLFRKGHRICIDIAAMDVPTGIGGATNAEYIPYHICSSKTVLHHIYHDAKRPSHLLLPIVPS